MVPTTDSTQQKKKDEEEEEEEEKAFPYTNTLIHLDLAIRFSFEWAWVHLLHRNGVVAVFLCVSLHVIQPSVCWLAQPKKLKAADWDSLLASPVSASLCV